MEACKAGKALVLGLGNILLSDEGLGVRVVERLQGSCRFPPEVSIMDGGTLGLDLLPYLEGVDHLLVIDALEMGKGPGTIVRLVGDEVPASLSVKISPHQMGLADLLAAARLRGLYPREIVLLGMQPGSMDTGLDLSPPVEDQVEGLIGEALATLKGWGYEPCRREGILIEGEVK
jgi:hydrogenase maturation protease